MKRSLILSILFVAFFSTQAFAGADGKGIYVSGNLGASFPNNMDLDDNDAGGASEIGLDTGFVGMFAVGYDFGMFRADGEFGYRTWDTGTVRDPDAFPAPTIYGSDGDVSTISFMVNGYYDHKIEGSKFEPYIGLGIGVANVKADITGQGGPSQRLDADDTVFAYQVRLGTAYHITEVISITADYQYFGTTSANLEDPQVFMNVDVDIASHDIMLGVRYMF